jgi:alcohol dehydrogenase class IV
LGAGYFIFDSVESDPSLSTVLESIAYATENSVTGVIGFGGGSPMDVAKLTALILGSKENLDDVWGVGNARGPRMPLCLIPTTAGTGSEVTPVSIITIEGEEKRGVVSPIILPDLAILDPSLTLGLPRSITAATGIDAMVHAIEAFTSESPNDNYLSQLMAREALAILSKSIKQSVQNGKNIEARTHMLMGSMMAGMAFANSPVAGIHALAYPLGATFNIPHGLSNALVLPEVLKFNSYNKNAASAYADLVQTICPSSKKTGSNESEAFRFSEYFRILSNDLGLPVRLRDLGIPLSALEKLASDAIKQTRLLVNNPRPINRLDALEIYRSAW